ncbi:BTAD domain-containing putative transcriptional regulator [Streptomyces sp. H27-C3]|uniref:AfsR/SARP family transcriptional regulator n=1 Tax=Streptomyces sp. H27-C3 TaxID=3046305 RepID=UPI0024BAFA8B|nr:BTAD domain-containing putative transcriptional regulator [Streptomyces sp. H27-C3]MDJ0464450.1 BTAD domain-containing putative transcriptional regulator [Streptomyces sp. H27-C3]
MLTHPRGYLVEVGPDAFGPHRFTDLVRRGRAALGEGAAARAAPPLREALGLWRGEPLSDLPAAALQDILPGLNEQLLDARELRIDADLALGDPVDVLPELRTLSEAHPLAGALLGPADTRRNRGSLNPGSRNRESRDLDGRNRGSRNPRLMSCPPAGPGR